MSPSSPYRTPTRCVTAEVVVDDGSRLRGELHLQPNKLAPGGYESLLEMLNRDDPFFPVGVEGDGVTLLAKDRTVLVSVSDAADDGERPGAGADTVRVPLGIALSTGRSLDAWALVEAPRPHWRALDFLNSSGTFVRIHDEEGMHYVNRTHIRSVHPGD